MLQGSHVVGKHLPMSKSLPMSMCSMYSNVAFRLPLEVLTPVAGPQIFLALGVSGCPAAACTFGCAYTVVLFITLSALLSTALALPLTELPLPACRPPAQSLWLRPSSSELATT